MLQRFLRDVKFFQILLRFDEDTAVHAREKGCEFCGGILHQADYPRKPRGMVADIDKDDCRRFSFCCSGSNCRKRKTPTSLRFLGRRVYLGGIVVLISAMLSGISPGRLRRLQAICGADLRTLQRWRQWWIEIFPRTNEGRSLVARLALIKKSRTTFLPRLLLRLQSGPLPEQILGVLRLLVSPDSLDNRGCPG
jgi:hypothetical protein